MRQTSFADMHCSLARTLDAVGDWWSPLILRDIQLGLTRFDELASDLGISRGLLTVRLEALIERGVLHTREYQLNPPRKEYLLTESGKELVPILVALTAWGDRWNAPEGPPLVVVHNCGEAATPVVVCGNCAVEVTSDNITYAPGPGGRVAKGTMLLPGKVLGRQAS